MEHTHILTDQSEIMGYLKEIYSEKKSKNLKKIAKHEKKVKYEHEYKTVREEILKRDNYKCCLCNSTKKLHVHHKIKRCDGGTNESDNLITLCSKCHKEQHKNDSVYKIM